jgi:hypothetical protein
MMPPGQLVRGLRPLAFQGIRLRIKSIVLLFRLPIPPILVTVSHPLGPINPIFVTEPITLDFPRTSHCTYHACTVTRNP